MDEWKKAIAAVQTADALSPLGARKGEMETAVQKTEEATVQLLKAWHAAVLNRRLATLEKTARDLGDKADDWKKAKNSEEAGAVTKLAGKVDEDIKKWKEVAASASAMTPQTARDVVVKLLEAGDGVADDQRLVAEALDKEIAQAAPPDDAATPPDDGTAKPDDAAAAAEAARKKEMTQLGARADSALNSLRKHQKALENKQQDWKEAGNADKEGEVGKALAEVSRLRDSLTEVKSLLKNNDLEGAKSAYASVEKSISPAEKSARKLADEKVVQPKDANAAGEEQIKAFLATLKCPGGMQRIITKNPEAAQDKAAPPYVAYCIDRYEYPGKGSMPKTNVSWDAANAACTAQGKRLCKNSEWKRACGGKYPYGSKYDPEACNTVGDDGIEKDVLPAGSKSKCAGSGLYDMVGNVAEWTAEKSVNGGDCNKTGEDATCGRSVSRFGGSPFVGFRCCADAQ
jgi:hypothetical protein